MLRIIKNFFINLGNLFKKPRTVVYPKEKIIIPEGSRGLLHLRLDLDTLEIICNGCGICEKICPENCINIKKSLDIKGRVFLEEFYIDLNKCIFCGSCVEFCKIGAIEMTYRYQLAEYKRRNLKFEKMDLIKQRDYTVRDFWFK